MNNEDEHSMTPLDRSLITTNPKETRDVLESSEINIDLQSHHSPKGEQATSRPVSTSMRMRSGTNTRSSSSWLPRDDPHEPTKKRVAVKPSLAPVQEVADSYPDWSVLESELEQAKTLDNAYFIDATFLRALTTMNLWLTDEGPFFMPRREFRHRHCIFNLFWQPSAPNWEKSDYIIPQHLVGLLRWYLTRDNFINKEAGNRLNDITNMLPPQMQEELVARGWGLYFMNMVYAPTQQIIFRSGNERGYQPFFGSTLKAQLKTSTLPEVTNFQLENMRKLILQVTNLQERIHQLDDLRGGPLDTVAWAPVRQTLEEYRTNDLAQLKKDLYPSSASFPRAPSKKRSEESQQNSGNVESTSNSTDFSLSKSASPTIKGITSDVSVTDIDSSRKSRYKTKRNSDIIYTSNTEPESVSSGRSSPQAGRSGSPFKSEHSPHTFDSRGTQVSKAKLISSGPTVGSPHDSLSVPRRASTENKKRTASPEESSDNSSSRIPSNEEMPPVTKKRMLTHSYDTSVHQMRPETSEHPEAQSSTSHLHSFSHQHHQQQQQQLTYGFPSHFPPDSDQLRASRRNSRGNTSLSPYMQVSINESTPQYTTLQSQTQLEVLTSSPPGSSRGVDPLQLDVLLRNLHQSQSLLQSISSKVYKLPHILAPGLSTEIGHLLHYALDSLHTVNSQLENFIRVSEVGPHPMMEPQYQSQYLDTPPHSNMSTIHSKSGAHSPSSVALSRSYSGETSFPTSRLSNLPQPFISSNYIPASHNSQYQRLTDYRPSSSGATALPPKLNSTTPETSHYIYDSSHSFSPWPRPSSSSTTTPSSSSGAAQSTNASAQTSSLRSSAPIQDEFCEEHTHSVSLPSADSTYQDLPIEKYTPYMTESVKNAPIQQSLPTVSTSVGSQDTSSAEWKYGNWMPSSSNFDYHHSSHILPYNDSHTMEATALPQPMHQNTTFIRQMHHQGQQQRPSQQPSTYAFTSSSTYYHDTGSFPYPGESEKDIPQSKWHQ